MQEKNGKELEKTRRVTIILSDEQEELLKLLKKKTGKTSSEILRDGLNLFGRRLVEEQELLKKLKDEE
jgi:predicted DNA-binding protein